MASGRRILAALPVFLIGCLTWVGGCYRPNIASGGFLCGPANACPDGFHCASDKRCFEGDGGPEAPTCEFPMPAPVAGCKASAAGATCNPICQTGCGCGFCNVASGAAKCDPVKFGTKDIGEVCAPQSDADCKPGLFCRPECQTTTLGRCYQLCKTTDDCDTPTKCNISIPNSSFSLCSLPDSQCDPIALTGCPANQSLLACYNDVVRQDCECMGATQAGAKCLLASDCMPGFTCISPGLGADATCQMVCRSSGDCQPPATTCNHLTSGMYGTCQ